MKYKLNYDPRKTFENNCITLFPEWENSSSNSNRTQDQNLITTAPKFSVTPMNFELKQISCDKFLRHGIGYNQPI